MIVLPRSVRAGTFCKVVFGPRMSRFRYYLCNLLTACGGAGYLISLSLSFPFIKWKQSYLSEKIMTRQERFRDMVSKYSCLAHSRHSRANIYRVPHAVLISLKN